MKNYYTKVVAPHRLGFLSALMVVMMASPSMAAKRNITDIELEKDKNQLQLKLSADKKADSTASFFTLRKDNIIEANLLNTNLDLPAGDSFKQVNPLPGIKAVEINQVDAEHAQILISTEPDTPIEHLLKEDGENLILSLNRVTKAESFQREVKELSNKAVTNLKQSYKSAVNPTKNKDNKKTEIASKDNTDSDVLIPNPKIVIDDNRLNDIKERVYKAQGSDLPETLPRAVAPPVGDMAVSNISTMPDMVDLGSRALVPRLVLRDAPVREVLSLLARSANLNIVFATDEEQGGGRNNNEETGPTISLDLENQPVQEVFNSVLLVSGLNANRRGNLIYVGEKLPSQARNLISRTIRLNQVPAENAALYLASQGAKGKILTTNPEEIVDAETGRVTQKNDVEPELKNLNEGDDENTASQPLLLRDLQVATDKRLNAITLVGEPRKVEAATAMLTQLDARRRQVSVNVKVLDVNLLNQDIFNSSFSFGVNDTFFSQDNGSAVLNFGDSRPPNNAEATNSQVFPTVSALQYPADIEPTAFLDIQNSPFGDITQGLNNFTGRVSPYARPSFGTNNNVFQPGLSDIDIDDEGGITYEYSLPSLYEFPKKFLAQLESQITSGNAKILTDPTLMVQEGQQATVKLVQNIVEQVKTEIDRESGTRTILPVIAEAGVVLTVNVERIDDNGFVSMSVSPTVSSIGATQNFDSGGGAVNELNLLSKRELSSGLVRLRDGQTLILSGIIQDQERTTISKVPVLGDIPLLGSLFRSTDKANERAEVIVLLTPEIVEEDAGVASNFSPSKESREVLNREGVGLLGN